MIGIIGIILKVIKNKDMGKKINKEKFIQTIKYKRFINMLDLKKVDFTNLFEGGIADKDIEDFSLTGLNNIDFITSDFLLKRGYKRKFKL